MSAHVQQQNISIKCQLYSVPRYLCSTFGGFKKKYIHPYERRYIEIDERENVQEIFTDTDIIFYTKKMHKRKQISNGDL